MKHSALWSCLFFAGLLFACAHLLDRGPSLPSVASGAPSSHDARRTHRVKVALDAYDELRGARERSFATRATNTFEVQP